MAIRAWRDSRLRRVARGRAGVALLALALYLGAGVLATSPALRDAGSHFLAYGRAVEGVVTPGDHLQTAYNLWLPGHQLARADAPWRDPYMWQPVAPERTNFAGWPFALVFAPLHAVLGTVGAWNAFVLLTYVGAGGFTALWLRSLGLPLGAALVGGLAFALAPYRSIQTSGGHLLGPIAMLLPLALWATETRRAWLAVAAIASIPLSGQVHLALGALPFFLVYALVRGRRGTALTGTAVALAAGMLVYLVSIRGTTGAVGRSFGQVERYSAEWLDFVSRSARHGFETFVFVGWLTPIAALIGLAVLARRDRGLALLLGVAVFVPIVVALGANTPLYEPLWEHVPALGHTRVPGRLLPIAALAVAALLAFALARVRWRRAALVAVVLVAADLRVDPYRPLVADEGNAAYAALGDGRLLEVPVYRPDRQEGSVYLYYAMQSPRERPLGYSTTAPPAADNVARALQRRGWPTLARSLGVRYIAFHRERFLEDGGTVTFDARSMRVIASDGGVVVLTTSP